MELTQRPVLRPLTVGQILDRAFRLYQGNFLTFLAIVAVVQLPLFVVQIFSALATQSNSAALIGLVSLLAIVIILATFVANLIASAALSRAVADVYLGRTTSFMTAYRAITPIIGDIFVTLIVAFLVIIGLGLFAIVPLVGWTAGVAMFVFFLSAIMPMLGTIVVLERKVGFDALRRGWDLTRRRFWPVVGYVLIVGLLVTIIIIGPSFLLNYLATFVWSDFDPVTVATTGNVPQPPLWATILQTVIQTGLRLLVLPIQLASASVLYFDLRVRNEGLDLELASALNMPEGSDLDTLLANAPAPETTQLLGEAEWKQFASLGCLFVIVSIVLSVVFWGVLLALLLPSFFR